MNEFIYDNRLYYNPIEFAMAHIGGTWKIPILNRARADEYNKLLSQLDLPQVDVERLVQKHCSER